MTIIAKVLCLFLLLMAIISCNGANRDKYVAAAAVAGTAGALEVVQQSRSMNPANQKGASRACCIVCDECTFPCGDDCIPYGTLCAAPKGCACWTGKGQSGDVQVPLKPPLGCPGSGEPEPSPSVPPVLIRPEITI